MIGELRYDLFYVFIFRKGAASVGRNGVTDAHSIGVVPLFSAFEEFECR